MLDASVGRHFDPTHFCAQRHLPIACDGTRLGVELQPIVRSLGVSHTAQAADNVGLAALVVVEHPIGTKELHRDIGVVAPHKSRVGRDGILHEVDSVVHRLRGAGRIGVGQGYQNIHGIDARARDDPVRLQGWAFGGYANAAVHLKLGILRLHAHDSVVPKIGTQKKVVLNSEFTLSHHLVGTIYVNAAHGNAPALVVLVEVAINTTAIKV